jgi:hypothetical protein
MAEVVLRLLLFVTWVDEVELHPCLVLMVVVVHLVTLVVHRNVLVVV